MLYFVCIPVVIVPVGSWDIRKIVLAGKTAQLDRLFIKIFEKNAVKVRNISMKTGLVTQGILILDESGFNVRQHACLACKYSSAHFKFQLFYLIPEFVKIHDAFVFFQ